MISAVRHGASEQPTEGRSNGCGRRFAERVRSVWRGADAILLAELVGTDRGGLIRRDRGMFFHPAKHSHGGNEQQRGKGGTRQQGGPIEGTAEQSRANPLNEHRQRISMAIDRKPAGSIVDE